MNINDSIGLCKEFAQWAQRETGPINHSSGIGRSAWGNCAVGCFCDLHDCSIDELLEAMECAGDEWNLVRELLNNSWPSTFEQLSRYISFPQSEKETILNAFEALQTAGMISQ